MVLLAVLAVGLLVLENWLAALQVHQIL